MSKGPVHKFSVSKISDQQLETAEDLLVTEEPLEIRLNHGSGELRRQDRIAVTMRTPGHDFELATGFLFTEGIVAHSYQILSVRYCLEIKDDAEEDNIVIVDLDPVVEVDLQKLERNFYISSSCGVCGKSSIESIQNRGCQSLPDGNLRMSFNLITWLPQLANENQTVFKHTGGLHAAVLFDADGNPVLTREDVGRHNAVDKIVGALLAESKIPGSEHILFLSGRAGFELVQKCVIAGIPVIAAVGAPSSLAVEMAKDFNLTLIGFLRGNRFNVYSGGQRIPHPRPSPTSGDLERDS